MEINDLIRLAAKADSEGNFRVADRITVKIENMSRTAINFGTLFGQLMDTIPGAIKGVKKSDPVPAGMKFFNGYHIPEANLAQAKSFRSQAQTNARTFKNSGGNTSTGDPKNLNQQQMNPIFNVGGGAAVPGPQGERGLRGYRGYKGLKGDPGPQGPAGKWWPGLVAGLLSGAIGAGGVAAWLSSRGADDVVIKDIENHLGRLPQYQMMTRRTDSGDLTGAKAIRAQNFVDSNSTNPRLKNQRDWYNLALQQSGGDENFANNVISLVKATPQMPSSIGGGLNI